jgi:hypothetical protein
MSSLLKGCLYITFELGFAASWFRENCATDVTSHLVDSIAEDKLFVATFGASDSQEGAVGFWDKFIPFTH